MAYIDDLKDLISGQVERFIHNVMRPDDSDYNVRRGRLSGITDPKYKYSGPTLDGNGSSDVTNDSDNPLNVISYCNTPFDHIDRILLQDFTSTSLP